VVCEGVLRGAGVLDNVVACTGWSKNCSMNRIKINYRTKETGMQMKRTVCSMNLSGLQ